MPIRRNPTKREVRNFLRALSITAPDRAKADAADAAMGLDRVEKVRAPRRDLEGAEQRALFKWARLNEHTYPDLVYLFHVPNGGMRNLITAARLKAEGVRAGIPDIFLDVPRRGFHGLRIELKAKEGGKRVSPEQAERIQSLDGNGYFARVAIGWEHAASMLEWYLTNDAQRIIDGPSSPSTQS